MVSKIAFLMNGEAEGVTLPKQFSWKVLPDGRWDYDNGTHKGIGHFITVAYSGAHGEASPADHGLHLGDVVGVAEGRCWRVKATRTAAPFDCWGIAMGWYEDSDGVLVQITGTVKGIGSEWHPGTRCCLPFYGYGKPEQATPRNSHIFPIGLALTRTDMLLTPRIDW